MEPTAILSFGGSKLPPKPASLAAHPAPFGKRKNMGPKSLNNITVLYNICADMWVHLSDDSSTPQAIYNFPLSDIPKTKSSIFNI